MSGNPLETLSDGSCQGSAIHAHREFQAGSTVELKGPHGLVGTGTLGPGRGDATICEFTFTIDNVPALEDGAAYAVTMKDSMMFNIGERNVWTGKEIADANWTIRVLVHD